MFVFIILQVGCSLRGTVSKSRARVLARGNWRSDAIVSVIVVVEYRCYLCSISEKLLTPLGPVCVLTRHKVHRGDVFSPSYKYLLSAIFFVHCQHIIISVFRTLTHRGSQPTRPCIQYS